MLESLRLHRLPPLLPPNELLPPPNELRPPPKELRELLLGVERVVVLPPRKPLVFSGPDDDRDRKELKPEPPEKLDRL